MTFDEVIEKRKSVRSYRNTPVPASAIEKIAHAVSLAPTACNRQPFKIIFVTDRALLAKLHEIYTPAWFAGAPAVAVVFGNLNACWTRLEGTPILDVDCAIAMEHLVLAAADSGLGTCWIGAFRRSAADALLSPGKGWTAVAMTPVGYPAADPVRPARKPVAEIFEVR